jgi:hypothetical protein
VTEIDYPAAHSMDTTWYAVDAAGHVAQFTSGENGHAPVLVENSWKQAMIEIESAWYLNQLFRTLHPEVPDWEYREDAELAEEFGFFLYDYDEAWDPIDAYERRLAPTRPVHVEQLPPEVREGCKKLRLPGILFTQAERIQPFEFFTCTSWDHRERIAYVAADGVTVRAVPGKERRFPDFVRRIRAERPDEAARYRFEGHDD